MNTVDSHIEKQCRIQLKKLTILDDYDVFEMLQNIDTNENEFKNEVKGMSYLEYKDWLKTQILWENGINLPEGYVPQIVYWLYVNDKPVGYGKLRTRLTEASRKNGGNIGYAISKNERGKGYGTILFKMLKEVAIELGINELLATVEKNNPTSKYVVEKCGGVIVAENEKRWYLSV